MNAFSVAFGGKADMAFCTAHVRFWPKADIGSPVQGMIRHRSGFIWSLSPKLSAVSDTSAGQDEAAGFR